MSRLVPVVLLALALPAFAVVTPIAPLEPRLGDTPFDDVAPRAASDGASTLVVWEAAFSPYAEAHSINGVFVQPADGTPIGAGFAIGSSATSARVATNGDEYLVAYGLGISRFNSFPVNNVAVRTVHRDGTVGPQQVINNSPWNYAGAIDVVWAADHWTVAFADGTPHLAFLRRDLQRFAPTVDLPAGSFRLLTIGGRVYAFQTTGSALKAWDVTDGQLVEVASAPRLQSGSILVAPTRAGAIIALSSSSNDLTAFSPSSGFSPSTSIAAGGVLFDMVPFGDNLIILHGGPPLVATTITESGTVVGTETILPSVSSATLLGSLLFVSTTDDPRAIGAAIVAFAMPRPQPEVEENGHLVSVMRTDRQSEPVIVSAGSYAMVFWNQTIDDIGHARAFSRRIDASGQPVGDPNELPFTMFSTPHGAFDGTRFILSWTTPSWNVELVAVSADGKTAGTPVAVLPPDTRGPSPPEVLVAASNDRRFALWSENWVLRGTPITGSGAPVVPQAFPLLPSIRPQTKPDISAFVSGFICVWKENDMIGAMVLSPEGTPSSVHTIGTDASAAPVVAGDPESALAAWLSATGTPVFVPLARDGGSFDLFDPHWGDHFDAVRLASAGIASHYFAGLVRKGDLFVGETGLQGAYVTERSTPRPIAQIGTTDFALVAVQGNPLAVWEVDGRVWIANGDVMRRRVVRH